MNVCRCADEEEDYQEEGLEVEYRRLRGEAVSWAIVSETMVDWKREMMVVLDRKGEGRWLLWTASCLICL